MADEPPVMPKPLTDVRVYVGNIPADFADAYYFRGLLEDECGRILLIDFTSILHNRRCSAFVHMMRDKDAEAAVAKLNGMTLDGAELYAHIKMSVRLMPGDRGYSRLASMIGDDAEDDAESSGEEDDYEESSGEEDDYEEASYGEEDGEEDDDYDAAGDDIQPSLAAGPVFALVCVPPQSPLPPLVEEEELSEEEESPTSVMLCAGMKQMAPFGLEKPPKQPALVEDSSEC